MTTENTPKKQRGRPFQKGHSGNPAGKPVGARNKATVAVEGLLQGQAEKLTQVAIDVAIGGDMAALKLCLDRICPPVRDRRITPESLRLPTLNTATLPGACAAVIRAVANGRLLPSEGQTIMSLLDGLRKSIELNEIDRRLQALESEPRIAS